MEEVAMTYNIKRILLAAVIMFALNSPQVQAVPGDSIGIELDVNTVTSGNQSESSTAMDAEGDFVITWHSDQDNNTFGVYAQRYNAGGSKSGVEFRVNATSSGTQSNPSVAMDADGNFVITWDSNQGGNPGNIYAQRYNADGIATSGEFPVNSFALGSQSNPSIAMDAGGDFVIAWNSFGQDGDDFGIYAQRYNADGSAAGDEFRVNTDTTGPQQAPSIAMNAGGDFVITWESALLTKVNGGDFDIYARRYNASGNPVGVKFQVNTATAGTQSAPSVALDAEGDFVITWHSDVLDNGDFDIYARRYNADGSDAGAGVEDLVNTVTTGDQASPSIAMDADGDFVITWHSDVLNNGDFDIYAQRYHANGSTALDEFRVNTFFTSNQASPGIAMDADDDFIIAWHSDGQVGSDNVYAQRYLGTAKKTIDLNLVVQDDADPVTTGNNFVYSLITTNNGSGIALDVNLNEPLPTGLSYVSDDAATSGWNCVLTGANLVCNKPFLNAAEVSTVNVTVTATAAGTLSSTVSASAAQTDASTADNADTETTVVNTAQPGTQPSGTTAVAPSSDEDLSTGSLGAISLLLVLSLWLRRRWLR